jgi:hypothetical protein
MVNIATACDCGRFLLKGESEVTGMIRHQDEEEKRVEEEYQKHKCKDCVWSKWQGKPIVSCLFPRCVCEKRKQVMFKRWELIFDWKEKQIECNRCKDVNNNTKYKKNSKVMCVKCLSIS